MVGDDLYLGQVDVHCEEGELGQVQELPSQEAAGHLEEVEVDDDGEDEGDDDDVHDGGEDDEEVEENFLPHLEEVGLGDHT